MIEYLTLAEVLALQADLIERFGGAHGVRDLGLLEAALYRPQTGYYADLIQQAAALWESLSQNHAFIDGNKRIGFACTYIFLALNGVRILANSEVTIAFLDSLYARNQFEMDHLEAWLRANTVQIRTDQ